MRCFRSLVVLTAAATVAAIWPAPAGASGGPILITAIPDGEGIDSPDGSARYATVSAGDTTVVKVMKGSGEIASMTYAGRTEKGRFGIPQVAADGSTSGLSADGKTLVLIKSRLPYVNPDRSSFVVLGTNRLHVKKRIGLDGQYSFDAISPDGRTAYVVEYPRPFRYDRYRVLKLDLKTGRLAKHPISDEDVGLEEEEGSEGGVAGEMRGTALSRIGSADGRWAYTLYDGGGDVPFIHALDTVGDEAVCIFLPQLAGLEGREIAKASIATGPEPGTISVVGREDQGSPQLARVDTATFAVTAPVPEVDESGPGVNALLILAGLALAGLGAGVFLLRRHRRTAAGATI